MLPNPRRAHLSESKFCYQFKQFGEFLLGWLRQID
jgi:hypothetical protein